MTIYFNNGFYDNDFHETIPENSHKLTNDYYLELLDGQGGGKMINIDDKGYPVLTDRPPSKYHTYDFKKKEWFITLENEVLKNKEDNEATKLNLLNLAKEQIEILKDLVEYGSPLAADKEMLTKWVNFRNKVNKIDTTDKDIIFPNIP